MEKRQEKQNKTNLMKIVCRCGIQDSGFDLMRCRYCTWIGVTDALQESYFKYDSNDSPVSFRFFQYPNFLVYILVLSNGQLMLFT